MFCFFILKKIENLIKFIKEVETVLEKNGKVTRKRVGINLDTANSTLYGTENPMNALEVLEKDDYKDYLFGVHAKEAYGVYNLDGGAGGKWGTEVPIGRGGLDWTEIMGRLHKLKYKGPIIMEREGQRPDITEPMAITSLRQKEMREGYGILRSADKYALQGVSSSPPKPFQ